MIPCPVAWRYAKGAICTHTTTRKILAPTSDRIFLWSTDGNTQRTSEILESLYRVLSNYELLERRISKTKLLLQNLVKPEEIETTHFLM